MPLSEMPLDELIKLNAGINRCSTFAQEVARRLLDACARNTALLLDNDELRDRILYASFQDRGDRRAVNEDLVSRGEREPGTDSRQVDQGDREVGEGRHEQDDLFVRLARSADVPGLRGVPERIQNAAA